MHLRVVAEEIFDAVDELISHWIERGASIGADGVAPVLDLLVAMIVR